MPASQGQRFLGSVLEPTSAQPSSRNGFSGARHRRRAASPFRERFRARNKRCRPYMPLSSRPIFLGAIETGPCFLPMKHLAWRSRDATERLPPLRARSISNRFLVGERAERGIHFAMHAAPPSCVDFGLGQRRTGEIVHQAQQLSSSIGTQKWRGSE